MRQMPTSFDPPPDVVLWFSGMHFRPLLAQDRYYGIDISVAIGCRGRKKLCFVEVVNYIPTRSFFLDRKRASGGVMVLPLICSEAILSHPERRSLWQL
jgi:hypothetical protein